MEAVTYTIGLGSVAQPEQWERITGAPEDVAEELHKRDGLNNGWWCAGVFTRGAKRGNAGWYGQGGLATIDVDYHGGVNDKGNPCKAPLPDDVGRMIMDAVAFDTLPWCLYAHTTPNGVRLVALLSKPIKVLEDYAAVATALMAEAQPVLAAINPLLVVDDCTKTAAQAAYLPGARVGGVQRGHSLREVGRDVSDPFDVEAALKALEAPADVPRKITVGGSRGADHSAARTAWLLDNALEVGTRMDCPLCGHHECFQVDEANRWHCYSTSHGADAPANVGRVSHDGTGVGDALDLAMHERGLGMVELLVQDGFIAPPSKPTPKNERATVLLPGHHHDGVQDLIQYPDVFQDEVIMALGEGALYRRSHTLVQLDMDEGALVPLNTATLHLMVSKGIHTYTLVKPKGKPVKAVYRQMNATACSTLLDGGYSHPSVRPVDMVATHPVLIRVGDRSFRLVDGEGYDAKARVYTVPHGLELRTNMSAAESREVLDDLLVDYPFTDEADRQNAIALLVTMICRTAMNVAPLFHVGASLPGTGKSKLITDTIGASAYGYAPGATMFKSAEEELRKYLDSELLKGKACSVLDNVPTGVRVDSAALAAMLTAPALDMRILGKTETMQVDNRMVMITTGNNSRWSSELSRRTCPITLTPPNATPESRTDFAHPHALEYALANRARTLSAVVSAVARWMVSGCPEPVKMPVVGSYEEWRNIVGGVMESMGYTQTMQNQNAHREEHGDGAREDAATLLNTLMADHGVGPGNAVPTRTLLGIADQGGLFQDDMDKAPQDEARRVSFFQRHVLVKMANQPTTSGWMLKTPDLGRNWFSAQVQVDIPLEGA